MMGISIAGGSIKCGVQCGRKGDALFAGCDLPQQEPFPLEPICLFVEGTKMTSDTRAHIRYVAGRQVARTFFHETSRMFTDAFDEVDWPQVHRTLNEEVPQLFQV